MLLHILGFCTQKFKIGVMIMQFCGGYNIPMVDVILEWNETAKEWKMK